MLKNPLNVLKPQHPFNIFGLCWFRRVKHVKKPMNSLECPRSTESRPASQKRHPEVSPDSDPQIVVVTMVNIQKTDGKITMFNGKIHYKWSFSIAMLNYQRVVTMVVRIRISWFQLIS